MDISKLKLLWKYVTTATVECSGGQCSYCEDRVCNP